MRNEKEPSCTVINPVAIVFPCNCDKNDLKYPYIHMYEIIVCIFFVIIIKGYGFYPYLLVTLTPVFSQPNILQTST